jgi:hypothetical protein
MWISAVIGLTPNKISDCSQKSSLALCETAILSIGTIHRIWTAVQNNIKDFRRGGIKARLLSGSKITLVNRLKSFDRILQTDSSMSLIITFSSFMAYPSETSIESGPQFKTT